jgi:hypothetical protein
MNILLLLPYIGVAIIVGVLINKYFVSKFEEGMRKVVYIITFVVCILVASGEFVISSVKKWCFDIINTEAKNIEEIIINQYPENTLVKNGVDISFIDEAIIELKNIMPKSIPIEYGIFNGIIAKSYEKIVTIAFERLESRKNTMIKYSENNIITLPSILGALKNDVLSHLNFIYLRWHLYVLCVLFMYIGYCIYTSNEEKKYYESSILFGDGAEGVERGMSGKEK